MGVAYSLSMFEQKHQKVGYAYLDNRVSEGVEISEARENAWSRI